VVTTGSDKSLTLKNKKNYRCHIHAILNFEKATTSFHLDKENPIKRTNDTTNIIESLR